jgi:hypothetical protein
MLRREAYEIATCLISVIERQEAVFFCPITSAKRLGNGFLLLKPSVSGASKAGTDPLRLSQDLDNRRDPAGHP